ncbi:uncharacterized protein LOC110901616 [Helianthus annuus]|uniref:uncharacterized protein LOC110901616 n=1 Tax=Helianthus annuus TaxID=4232 RepID=UPI000B90092E|nr:uncharacterized protein LOC110901616 [Helianthus annuus]
MRDGEQVGDYFSRVMSIVSQKRVFGEKVADQIIVEKILRSMSPKFDHVVPSIEVSFDLSKLSPVKLMGSLQSQEERINRRSQDIVEENDEHALQVFQDNNPASRFNTYKGRGRALHVGEAEVVVVLIEAKFHNVMCAISLVTLKGIVGIIPKMPK